MDNPHVRSEPVCPLCHGAKPVGLVACWPCFRLHNLKVGDRRAEQIIARREAELAARKVARRVGDALNVVYPWGYRSQDNEP